MVAWKPDDILTAVWESPRFHTCSNLAKFAVYHFISIWYRSGCYDSSDYNICEITGLKANAWLEHKFDIEAALTEIMPKVQALRHDVETKEVYYQEQGAKLRAGWTDKKYKRRNQKVSKSVPLTDSEDNHLDMKPVMNSVREYHPGFHDNVAIKKAKAAKDSKPSKLFTDE